LSGITGGGASRPLLYNLFRGYVMSIAKKLIEEAIDRYGLI